MQLCLASVLAWVVRIRSLAVIPQSFGMAQAVSSLRWGQHFFMSHQALQGESHSRSGWTYALAHLRRVVNLCVAKGNRPTAPHTFINLGTKHTSAFISSGELGAANAVGVGGTTNTEFPLMYGCVSNIAISNRCELTMYDRPELQLACLRYVFVSLHTTLTIPGPFDDLYCSFKMECLA